MRILLPMVTMVEEFQRARSMLEQVRADLAAHDVPHDPQVPLGAMIEVPAAALAARSLAAEADFLSIGTNDLSQYALAVDRNNARVAGLYQTLHPGLLQLLRVVMDSVPEAEKRVSVCGEMAGDADAVLLLLGLGVRALSMSPYHLPVVRRLLQAVTIEEAEALTEKVLDMGSTAQIRSALRAETLRLVPDLSTLLGPS